MAFPLEPQAAQLGAEMGSSRLRRGYRKPLAQCRKVRPLPVTVVGINQDGEIGRTGRSFNRLGWSRVYFLGQEVPFGVVWGK